MEDELNDHARSSESAINWRAVPGDDTKAFMRVDGHDGNDSFDDADDVPHPAFDDVDEHGNPKRPPGEASMFSCIINLSNTILGAGMLGLPHAFANSGYLLGSILLVVFATLSAFGLHLLAEISSNISEVLTKIRTTL
eukprot:CAMPEP_0184504326 /NCGR_PEP_ID=MMETSP0113_2-20130426/52406_1 /TAXON_ID=91329 /ORGANISM="Norrisiella sphaerica, Strain BC52" /LENGTH=137 /DNA_ID=CAMNT_0026893965 /DNA_START=71 /DNA_END=485 /DNA_ORIENTATION=-